MSGKMSTRSRKAKGRALQNLVVNKLYSIADKVLHISFLSRGDIKGAVMGETGADIKFSPAAQKVFPFNIECKNQEKFKGIYDAYAQCQEHEGPHESVVIIKMNRQKPLAIVDMDYFFDIYLKSVQQKGDK